jgi:hypothetical protein
MMEAKILLWLYASQRLHAERPRGCHAYMRVFDNEQTFEFRHDATSHCAATFPVICYAHECTLAFEHTRTITYHSGLLHAVID